MAEDSETIAKLATGLQRFTLPDEFNWIKIFERVAGRAKDNFGQQARDGLAGEFEDRRQYVKAAAAWRRAIKEYGQGQKAFRQARLDQIVGNWGQFESHGVQPAGVKPTVDFRFRNGKKVRFEALSVKVEQLLEDMQEHMIASVS